MNWMQLLVGILPSLIELAPRIIKAWNTPSANGVSNVANVINTKLPNGTSLASILLKIGAAEFPKLAPEFQAVAAALVHVHANNTAYAQEALNIIKSTGYIDFGPPLVVDGYWGPKTKAAVMALQTKLGMPVNGFLADAEFAALEAILSREVSIPA